ncbi:MAG TPA: hypothetical protein VN851_01770 [Thermoanaerobaculia bacterium]|nr:hypothetical protein [Thermoanaerobaculia bacterium]
MKLLLCDISHARSGDKGDARNFGLVAASPALYEVTRHEVAPERVKAHFAQVGRGEVDRYDVPSLNALNFILHDALGGDTKSLKTDAPGLLRMEIEVPTAAVLA